MGKLTGFLCIYKKKYIQYTQTYKKTSFEIMHLCFICSKN